MKTQTNHGPISSDAAKRIERIIRERDRLRDACRDLLVYGGCDCGCHPDDLPDGVAPCTPCQIYNRVRDLLDTNRVKP